MRLLLIRHAQSANNALPEEQRVEDPPLTELGHRQASALGKWLTATRLDYLVASPFRRSLETTEYIRRQMPVEAHVWIDLHEQGGCYAGHEPHRYQGRPGLSQVQIKKEFPAYQIDPDIGELGWWRCQPYETDEQATARATRLIQRTIREFGRTAKTIAYVMHADFKRKFLETLFIDSNGMTSNLASIYNTAVTTIEFAEGSPRLHVYNSTEHLPSEMRTL